MLRMRAHPVTVTASTKTPRRNYAGSTYFTSLDRQLTFKSDVIRLLPDIRRHRMHFKIVHTKDKLTQHHTEIYLVSNHRFVYAGKISATLDDNNKPLRVDTKLNNEHLSNIGHVAEFIRMSYEKVINSEEYWDIYSLATALEEDYCFNNKDPYVDSPHTFNARLVPDPHNPLCSSSEAIDINRLRKYFVTAQNISREIYADVQRNIPQMSNISYSQLSVPPSLKHLGGTDDDEFILGFRENTPVCLMTPLGMLPFYKGPLYDIKDDNREFYEKIHKKYKLKSYHGSHYIEETLSGPKILYSFYQMSGIPHTGEKIIHKNFTNIRAYDYKDMWYLVKPQARMLDFI